MSFRPGHHSTAAHCMHSCRGNQWQDELEKRTGRGRPVDMSLRTMREALGALRTVRQTCAVRKRHEKKHSGQAGGRSTSPMRGLRAYTYVVVKGCDVMMYWTLLLVYSIQRYLFARTKTLPVQYGLACRKARPRCRLSSHIASSGH